MRNDLSALMQAHNIDVLLIVGPAQHNAPMVYMTGGGHVTQADLVIKRGETPVLFHGPMERDEAAKSGFITRSYSNYPFREMQQHAHGSKIRLMALRYQKMLEDLGITSGRMALLGATDLGTGYGIFTALKELMPELELVALEEDLLMQAMMTKEPQEIEQIRQMGKVTTQCVANTADFLTSHAVRNGMLVKTNGEPLVIGDVRKRINLWLAEAGAENPEGTIFSIGRDAGVPHSVGIDSAPLRLGQTIVYDIYPCELGGGYFYDFTRTWCLGYATDEAQKLYEDVRKVYETVVSELQVNMPFANYQKRTCELFESMGHPTVLSTPETEVGYVHSLGHGVGLRIHELPMSGAAATTRDILAPGSVFTIEPGLYYPDKGMGVRIEDTLAVMPNGAIEILVDYPKELVLPVKLA